MEFDDDDLCEHDQDADDCRECEYEIAKSQDEEHRFDMLREDGIRW